MTAILDHPQVRNLRVGARQTARVSSGGRPATLPGRSSVVALRQRRAIALGSLADRSVLPAGGRLVTAHDATGHSWWIPADAVWSDADAPDHPEHPRPIGLATAGTREAALIKGISDRLGWEAVLEFERGGDLPAATGVAESSAHAIVLDGRLGHGVPTVVVLAADTMRWGAAATWDGAMRRALYGDDPLAEPAVELEGLSELLAAVGLAVASVDLGTPRLQAAGVVRCSVQLVAGNGSVRSWDAD